MLSKDPKVKNGCSKNHLEIARDNPAELYPQIDFFITLLDDENKILKWTAIYSYKQNSKFIAMFLFLILIK